METQPKFKIGTSKHQILSMFDISKSELFKVLKNDDKGLFISMYYNPQDKHRAYRLNIDKTDCHLGGCRYWFKCPECDCRIAKLYKLTENSKYKCRECSNMTYWSKFKTTTEREFPYIKNYVEEDLYVMQSKIKRKYYRGKMTKKHRRYTEIQEGRKREFQILLDRVSKNYVSRKRSCAGIAG